MKDERIYMDWRRMELNKEGGRDGYEFRGWEKSCRGHRLLILCVLK